MNDIESCIKDESQSKLDIIALLIKFIKKNIFCAIFIIMFIFDTLFMLTVNKYQKVIYS